MWAYNELKADVADTTNAKKASDNYNERNNDAYTYMHKLHMHICIWCISVFVDFFHCLDYGRTSNSP